MLLRRVPRRTAVRHPIWLQPQANQLLAALPPGDWERWMPQLERVEMPLGQVLYESGAALSHVYFRRRRSSRCST
jgi:hypothetical protein